MTLWHPLSTLLHWRTIRTQYDYYLPMKTQGVQECGEAFHEKQDGDGENGPRYEDDEDPDDADVAVLTQRDPQHHQPQHLGQLWWREKTKYKHRQLWRREKTKYKHRQLWWREKTKYKHRQLWRREKIRYKHRHVWRREKTRYKYRHV